MTISAFAMAFNFSAGTQLPSIFTAASPVIAGSSSLLATIAADNPADRLQQLSTHLSNARQALTTQAWHDAGFHYQHAAHLLAGPLNGEMTHRLFASLPDGEALHAEATIGGTIFSSSDRIPQALSHLTTYESLQPPSDKTPKNKEQAALPLLRAHAIVRFASSTNEQRMELYRRAENLVEGWRTSHARRDFPELALSSDLLMTEIIARQVERAHRQQDYAKRRELISRLHTEVKLMRQNYSKEPDSTREVVGKYWGDATVLLARMGLWGEALREARNLTEHEHFGATKAAQDLLHSELFVPFVENGRILRPEEISKRSRNSGFLARIKAAIAHAHSTSLKETMAVGFGGAAFGALAESLSNGTTSFLPAAMAAATALGVKRFANGWKSEEAKAAEIVGNQKGEELSSTLPGYLAKQAFDGALIAGVSSFAATAVGSQGRDIMLTTLGKAADLYGRFGLWLASGIPQLVNPDFYKHSIEGITSFRGDPTELALSSAYHIYSTSAGVVYGAYLFFPSLRKPLEKIAILFTPAAVLLGKDAGMAIAGETGYEYVDRINRGGLALVEGISMLLTTGVISLASNKSVGDVAESTWKSFKKADHNALIGIALTVGISSALGAKMQSEKQKDISLIALQGAAITVGLLPIVLGVSGILKRNINIGQGIVEGWHDSSGQPIFRRLIEMGESASAAFLGPYPKNRVLRGPTYDVPTAAIRTHLGWDTNAGYGAFMLGNMIATNPAVSMIYPEVGGTDWYVGGLKKAMLIKDDPKADETERKKKRDAEVLDFLRKAAQVMPFAHSFYPHTLSDRLYQLTAIRSFARQPRFPRLPEGHTLAMFHQVLTGRHHLALSREELSTFLACIGMLVEQPEDFDAARPLVQTLSLARNSSIHGEAIEAFFDHRPWIFDLLDISPETLTPPSDRRRLRERTQVRKQVDVPRADYIARVREHAAAERKVPSYIEDLF
ncbi:MAG: hypothetical protein HY540_05020 [Deltaproteobacteria bacterium]|nr:hypothetical protein [Deltaproteobacteria bacterium]